MFILLIGIIVVLSLIGRLFSRPFYGYHRPWYYPFGVFGGWGMMGHHHHHHHHHPMGHCGPHHHHHHW